MDLQMPGFNGVEATRRIVANSPDIRVLVLTMFEDDAPLARYGVPVGDESDFTKAAKA